MMIGEVPPTSPARNSIRFQLLTSSGRTWADATELAQIATRLPTTKGRKYAFMNPPVLTAVFCAPQRILHRSGEGDRRTAYQRVAAERIGSLSSIDAGI